MLVCSQAVMMLRMIVIDVRVDVQPRALAGRTGQGKPEQDCYEATHYRRVYVTIPTGSTERLRRPMERSGDS